MGALMVGSDCPPVDRLDSEISLFRKNWFASVFVFASLKIAG
jgi:hypothetical protein